MRRCFPPQPPGTHAVWRRSSICLSHTATWFQLAGIGDAKVCGQKIPEKNRRVRVWLASHMPDCRSRMRHHAINDVTVEDVAFDRDEVNRIVDGGRCQRRADRAELSSDRSAKWP